MIMYGQKRILKLSRQETFSKNKKVENLGVVVNRLTKPPASLTKVWPWFGWINSRSLAIGWLCVDSDESWWDGGDACGVYNIPFGRRNTLNELFQLIRERVGSNHPQALVIPTVLFTDRTKWRKDVVRKLETKLNDRLFLHFEYLFFKLFDFNARDYYNIKNPVVKILLPKMNYKRMNE